MNCYQFVALTVNGQRKSGIRAAQSKQDLVTILEQNGLTPHEIEQKAALSAWPHNKPKLLSELFQDLALYLEGATGLAEALKLVADDADDVRIKAVAGTAQSAITRGQSIGDAFNSCAPFVPPFVTQMLRVGGHTGQLASVTNDIGEYYEQRGKQIDDIISQLTYPVLVLIVGIGALIFALGYVLPRFKELLAGQGGELPLLTQAVMSIGTVFSGWSLLLISIVSMAGIYAAYQFFQTDSGRETWDWLETAIYLRYETQHAFFCSAIATMLQSGVQFEDALELASPILNNQFFESDINDVLNHLRQGEGVATSFELEDIKGYKIGMLRAAERSNSLARAFTTHARRFERRSQKRLERYTSLLEPIVVIGIAGLIALLMAAVLLPIVNLTGTL